MTPFTVLTARSAVLGGANVDTDQIIPARFLRKPRSAGYGNFLFHDLAAARDAVLGAGVLFTGANFGCGSSREGAVYALVDAGVRCLVATSFGDIFAGNAIRNGLLTVVARDDQAAELRQHAATGGTVTVDLPGQWITGAAGARMPFKIDPFCKQTLVEGLDDIAMTLSYADALAAWAARDSAVRPWAAPSA